MHVDMNMKRILIPYADETDGQGGGGGVASFPVNGRKERRGRRMQRESKELVFLGSYLQLRLAFIFLF